MFGTINVLSNIFVITAYLFFAILKVFPYCIQGSSTFSILLCLLFKLTRTITLIFCASYNSTKEILFLSVYVLKNLSYIVLPKVNLVYFFSKLKLLRCVLIFPCCNNFKSSHFQFSYVGLLLSSRCIHYVTKLYSLNRFGQSISCM